jgi:hypothetical protein
MIPPFLPIPTGSATEGGFFGLGGERVTAAEAAAINELASSLGLKA